MVNIVKGIGQVIFLGKNRGYVVPAQMFAQSVIDALVIDLRKPDNKDLAVSLEKGALGSIVFIKGITEADFSKFESQVLKCEPEKLAEIKNKLMANKDANFDRVPDELLPDWVKRSGIILRFKWVESVANL